MIRLTRILFRAALASAFVLAAWPAFAIVIRHDKDDQLFRDLGEKYPAAVSVLPDGSGVLVGPEWVLTAGHVARGVSGRNPRVEAAGKEFDVVRIFTHPDWTSMEHDIALLKLREPVEGIAAVKLYDRDDEVGQQVTFVGRGDFGTGLTGPREMDRVKRGATNILEEADANWVYFTFDEPASATELEGVSGPGDSGGPALVTRDGTVYTVGVSVFADGPGGPGRYGVREGYTRVSTHRDWIEAVLSGQHDDKGFAPGSGPTRARGQSKGRSKSKSSGPGGSPQRGSMARSLSPLPGTAAGRLVKAYVEAYNTNDWAKMDAFSIGHFAKSFLGENSEDERHGRYRRLRDEHLGSIELRGMVDHDDASITVLFDSSNKQMAEFRFELTAGDQPKIAGIRVALVKIDTD